MIDILSFLFLSLALGFRHSYDADHLLAVSNILKKAKSVKPAIKIGFSWAAGHMLTASVITALIYLFMEPVLKAILPHFEKIAGVMLVILGFFSLKRLFQHSHNHKHGKTIHSHPHLHNENRDAHVHKHAFGIGIIHGLASNDELILLITASLGAATLGSVILGIGFFGIGVVLGMTLFCLVLSFSLLKIKNKNICRMFIFGSGAMSIAYGSIMFFGG